MSLTSNLKPISKDKCDWGSKFGPLDILFSKHIYKQKIFCRCTIVYCTLINLNNNLL